MTDDIMTAIAAMSGQEVAGTYHPIIDGDLAEHRDAGLS